MTNPYLEHLTDGDLAFLARIVGGENVSATAGRLRADRRALGGALAAREVHRALFEGRTSDPLLVASPFLLFSVCVHRAADDLHRTASVAEWIGPRKRVPLLDVARLRAFIDDSSHRLFLAELLASYTRVSSGAMWERSRRGWRRHRFSELDPVRLAQVAEMVPEAERPGVYRRLGDLALFLAGVFPEHGAAGALGPLDRQRLARVGGSPTQVPSTDIDGLSLLEELGRRCYGAACATASPVTASVRVVESIASRFGEARRVLNFIAERYVFAHRTRWFGPAA